MEKIPDYPLEQVALIKKKREEEAEKVLKERKEALEVEEKKLEKVKEERDKVKKHKADKLKQLNDKFEEGITSDEIQMMERYLKVVDEQLKAKEDKVTEQQTARDAADKAVVDAKADLNKKQLAVEKMRIHRKEWEKEMKFLLQVEQGKHTDDIGTIIHARNKRS